MLTRRRWLTATFASVDRCGELAAPPAAQVGKGWAHASQAVCGSARSLLPLRLVHDGVTPAVAVVVHSAVDAAAAMQKCVEGWTDYKNVITVDPATASVSYQQHDSCVVFSASSEPPIQYIEHTHLPASFTTVHQAQQVGRAPLPTKCSLK